MTAPTATWGFQVGTGQERSVGAREYFKKTTSLTDAIVELISERD